ncbi:unnamed protein product [Adineta steineri]|uniref:RING-type E3 ubiquitin transferase n=1 Tax=Adineta steineri TaxID=433720 RepID=A0A818UZA9_9BILA|nr:unnamed protein product [Adineta steineri]
MATAETDYYCHKCQVHIGPVTNFECPHCKESFIEEVPPEHPLSQSQTRQNRRTQYHTSLPMGNTTIFIGGGGGNNPTHNTAHLNDNTDIGTFFQTVLAQLAGGLVGGGASQSPFFMHNSGGAGLLDTINLDAFLTQFLNQMGENGGPAPASENRINTIPTVKVTAEQARDSLQCAICMDDFKENDEAKRLPCSHHFHEDCISRWLRMHGTCPTCRVTLDGDNTSNREYYNLFSNQQQQQQSPSWNNNNNNNNRRNDGDNNGSSSGAGSTLLDFD